MNPRKPLSAHEIRVIKIDRNAIFKLVGEILNELSYEKFRIPHNKHYDKKICIDWFFDENQCEILVLAYNRAYKANAEIATTLIKDLSLGAIDSLIQKPNNKKYYYSILSTSHIPSSSTSICLKENSKQRNILGILFDHLGVRARQLKKREIRIIRLSSQAIHELLWEHFMKTGDEMMDIPEEEIGDIRTIFHMYTKGKLEELTLYVMNFNEASDEAFGKNKEYCDQNIAFTTDAYSKKSTKGCNYQSIILPSRDI